MEGIFEDLKLLRPVVISKRILKTSDFDISQSATILEQDLQ